MKCKRNLKNKINMKKMTQKLNLIFKKVMFLEDFSV